jgi:hypothetical protein
MRIAAFALCTERGGRGAARLQIRCHRVDARPGRLQLRLGGFCTRFERGGEFRMVFLQHGELSIALPERVPHLSDGLVARRQIRHECVDARTSRL